MNNLKKSYGKIGKFQFVIDLIGYMINIFNNQKNRILFKRFLNIIVISKAIFSLFKY